MSYYKVTNQRKMDHHLLDLAHASIEGASDGRISITDAKKLFAAVKDGNVFTEVERDTVDHILATFNWTEKAKDWFLNELHAWRKGEQVKPSKPMSLQELAKQHFATRDVLRTEEERLIRIHDLTTAMNETNQDHDDIGLIVRLANNERIEVISNFIELSGDFIELKGGITIPVKAIEKVEI